MSVNLGGSGAVHEFFHNVQSGKLTQVDPNFSLKDKTNLTALKQFISNKEMSFEELSQFTKGIKQLYSGEDKVLGKVFSTVRPRLTQSIESVYMYDISDLEAALNDIDAMGWNGNDEELKIQCAKQYLSDSFDRWCTHEKVLTHLLNVMKLAKWSDDAKLSLGLAVGLDENLHNWAQAGHAVFSDEFRTQFQDPKYFVRMLMQIEKGTSKISSTEYKKLFMTHAKLIGEHDKDGLAYVLKKHSPNNRMDVSSLKELMQIDRQFVIDYFSADLIIHRSEIPEVISRLEDRIQFAQKCLVSDPETLSNHFFDLFTPEELHGDLTAIFTDMIRTLSSRHAIGVSFLEKFMKVDRQRALSDCAVDLMTHYVKMSEEVLSLEERIDIAQKCLIASPKQFARHLLNVFTDDEILGVQSSTFTGMINTAGSLLKEDSSEGAKEALSYLENQQLYLERMSKGNQEHINDCHHWDCLGETESGCLIFKLKWIHDPNASEKYRAKDAVILNDNNDDTTGFATEPIAQSVSQELLSDREIFESLGFRYEEGPSGVYFTIPNKETLVKNWDHLRNSTYAGYPSFSLGESSGIASSEEFLAILQDHSIVLSNGREFIHDMFAHAMATFKCIFEDHRGYTSSFEEIRALSSAIFERLETEKVRALTSQEQAALAGILEFHSLLYDVFTGSSNVAIRQDVLSEWRAGSFITKEAPLLFPYLWQQETWRAPLRDLGLTYDGNSFKGIEIAAENVKRIFLSRINL